MLITVMAGVAGTVILSTQQDLSLAGQDREALAAFYAAEDGVAQAKAWLAARPAKDDGAGGGWTAILGELESAPEGCAGGTRARRDWAALDASTRFTFCIHTDAASRREVLTIEAWGVSAAAQAHIAVDVAPSLATIEWRQY